MSSQNTPRLLVRQCTTAACVAVALLSLSGQYAASQQPARRVDQVVQVPVEQLNQIQRELEYLRHRDQERQVWEDSMVQRLPNPSVVNTAARRYQDNSAMPVMGAAGSAPLVQGCANAGCPGCGGQGCSSCGNACSSCGNGRSSCCCGGCLGVGCPLAQAPCVNCPRISTVNPYFNINVFGALKLDMMFNSARPVAPGTPFFLAPNSPGGLNEDTFDIHARQTNLGAMFQGPQMGDFQSGGLILAMLYNDALIVDQYGFLPLQAYGELKNRDWRFAAGLQFDVFAPGAPTVLPFSSLAGSGNSGNAFRGQIRVERFITPADDLQWTLQAALSEPIITTIDPVFGISEDNGLPNLEGRVAMGVGPLDPATGARPMIVGVSGVVGQIRTTVPGPVREVTDVWGIALDFRLPLSEASGIAGEMFTGQALGTYNAGVLQNINRDTLRTLRTSGGWCEFFTYLNPRLHSHSGFGIDNPNNRDVAFFGRSQNSVIYTNLLWDLNAAFRVGTELTWRDTHYRAPSRNNQGIGLHTQFQWSF